MKNPIITMRESLQLSQRELAETLDTSQQFIQRHEIGQAASLPNRIGDYYDHRTSARDRIGILADLIEAAGVVGSTVPSSYIPGTKYWSESNRTTGRLYNLWVRISRSELPDLSRLCEGLEFDPEMVGQNAEQARAFFYRLRRSLNVPDSLDSHQQVYEIASLLKFHPYVLSRFLSHPERSTDIPPTIRLALMGTQDA